MNQYIQERYNRKKMRSRISLGVQILIQKPVINLLWVVLVACVLAVVYGEGKFMSIYESESFLREALKQQEEQYKKEKLYDKEIIRIQKRPYLVVDKSSTCMCNGNSDHHMTIYFRNKGNGSAFKIEPVTQITASNGNTIFREEPIQDPIVMVNELCETKWKFDSPKRGFQFSITVKFEDMSAQLYQQTFILTLDSRLHIMVTNYAEPELVNK